MHIIFSSFFNFPIYSNVYFFFARCLFARVRFLFLTQCLRVAPSMILARPLHFKAFPFSLIIHTPRRWSRATPFVGNRGTPCTEFLASQFHPRTRRANFKFLLSTVYHDRLRTPGVRRIHSQWRACEGGPLWKVAEIAGNREIRLGIRKRMKNASTPLPLVVISAIFITASQQTYFPTLLSMTVNCFSSNWPLRKAFDFFTH